MPHRKISDTDRAFSHAGSSISTPVGIADGGTGQTSQTAAFDALGPGTTKGDLLVHDGSDHIRLAVGSNDQVLTADSGEASGVKWAAAAAGGGGFTLVTKSGDQNFSSTSLADVTDLSFSASANTNYLVRAIVVASTAGSTTGYGLGLNGPTGTYLYWALQSTNGSTTQNMDPAAKAADTALVSATGSATELAGMIEGVVQVGGSGGTIALRARSENTNTITIHQESILLYQALS